MSSVLVLVVGVRCIGLAARLIHDSFSLSLSLSLCLDNNPCLFLQSISLCILCIIVVYAHIDCTSLHLNNQLRPECYLGISSASTSTSAFNFSSRSFSLSLPSISHLINPFLKKKMAASTRIPPIAQPFVSDRAKKTLDLVLSPTPQLPASASSAS